jgi:short-subunit dehydrogenase involved in D-alanine esterification of teichoic acids
MMTKSNL